MPSRRVRPPLRGVPATSVPVGRPDFAAISAIADAAERGPVVNVGRMSREERIALVRAGRDASSAGSRGPGDENDPWRD